MAQPRPSKWLYGSATVLGGRFPYVILALIVLTLATTILGQWSAPIRDALFFSADSAFRGEVWRLVTWVFLAHGAGPVALIFGCFALAFLGRELYYDLGPRRFLGIYFGVAVLAAGVMGLLGLIWPTFLTVPVFGMWPVLDALVILFAVRFPHRQILAYFVIPVGGWNLVVLTIAGTLLFALLDRPILYIPHFTAEILALIYTDVISFRKLWLRLQYSRLEREYRRRTSGLREVPKDRWVN